MGRKATGSIRQTTSGSWEARTWEPALRKQVTLGSFATHAEASEAITLRSLETMARGTQRGGGDATLLVRLLGGLSPELRRVAWVTLDRDPYIWDASHPRPT